MQASLCNNSSVCSLSEAAITEAPSFDPGNRLTADLVEISIYVLCLSTGGPLNILSFYRSTRLYKRDIRNRSQILLLRIHLNIADLLTMFVYTTTQIIWMTTFQWYGGDILCRVCKFFYTFSFYLNSFVVAGIAVDRVYGAYKINSLKASEMAYRRVRRTLLIAYMCATLFSLPQLVIFRVFRPDLLGDFRQCTPVWTIYAYEYDIRMQTPNLTEQEKLDIASQYFRVHRWEQLYNMAHLLLLFWIPTLIIASSYVFVICRLNSLTEKRGSKTLTVKAMLTPTTLYTNVDGNYDDDRETLSSGFQQSSGVPAYGANSGGAELERQSGRRHVAFSVGSLSQHTIHRATSNAKKQAALILLAYLTLWSPYNVMALMNTLAPSSTTKETILETMPFLNALIVVNPVVNPIIYGLSQRRHK